MSDPKNQSRELMQTHMDIMLGDSLETILSKTQEYLPRISEYQFEREVLDILTCPFGKQAIGRYLPYVGEFIHPLQVVDNQDNTRVLFEVPPLTLPIRTSMPSSGGVNVENVFRGLSREIELGLSGRHEKVAKFLHDISGSPEYIRTVVEPIIAILARYGREMVTPDGEPLTVVNGQLVLRRGAPSQHNQSQASDSGSSFLDEFED